MLAGSEASVTCGDVTACAEQHVEDNREEGGVETEDWRHRC